VWGLDLGGTGHFSTHYLRTHSEHVTTWKTNLGNSAFSGAEFTSGVGAVTNGLTYRMEIEVDYIA
jgi:hypothetical protein